MRYWAIIVLLFLGTARCVAQNADRPNIYAEAGGGYGNYGVLKAAFTVNWDNNILSIAYLYNSRHARNLPSDYHAGFLSGLPQEQLKMVGIMYGWMIFTENPRLRFAMKGGLAGGVYRQPASYTTSGGWLGPNYGYISEHKTAVGLVLNPTIEFPVTRGWGMAVGGYANINNCSSVIALETTMQFGDLRKKEHPTTQ